MNHDSFARLVIQEKKHVFPNGQMNQDSFARLSNTRKKSCISKRANETCFKSSFFSQSTNHENYCVLPLFFRWPKIKKDIMLLYASYLAQTVFI